MGETSLTASSGVSAAAVRGLSLVLPPGAFRLLLAFMVVASHLSGYDIGRLAVVLFFYLSGYWVTRLYKEKFGPGSVGRFYLSRYWRLAPLFFLATFAAAIARDQGLGWSNFTLLGLASTGEATDPTHVSWSLDLELQFYLLLPLLIPLLERWPRVVCYASVPLALAGSWLDTTHHVLTVAKFLPAFLLGALTFQASYAPSAGLARGSLVAFGLLSAVTAFTPFLFKAQPDPFDRDLWAMVWCLPLLPYVARSLLARSSRADRVLGDITYPLYLFHPLVIFLLGGQAIMGLGEKALAAGLSFALAGLLWWAFDRNSEKVRRIVTESTASPARQAAPPYTPSP